MSLQGIKVALLETRMGSELAALVRRHKGEPCNFPSLREVPLDCTGQLDPLLETLESHDKPFVVFSRGVGVEALFATAEVRGKVDALRLALRKSVTVCRGPKPSGVLSRHAIQTSIKVRSPHTTTEVLAALQQVELDAQQVVVIHHGERNLPLVAGLDARGARVTELTLYEWKLPEDVGPLHELVEKLISRDPGAVVFTSQIQAKHLFVAAAAQGLDTALRSALRDEVIVASIGPTCSAALEALGVSPDVVPQNPKMVPLVQALAAWVGSGRGKR